jgi:hypothetical protein
MSFAKELQYPDSLENECFFSKTHTFTFGREDMTTKVVTVYVTLVLSN